MTALASGMEAAMAPTASRQTTHQTISLHPADRALLARAFAMLIGRGMGMPADGDSFGRLKAIEDIILEGWPRPAEGDHGSPQGSGQ